MKIEYDTKLGIYKMPYKKNTATSHSRMLLINLACGLLDEETHDDEDDFEEEDEDYDATDDVY